MRVHLPALLALASATTYAACGSSDPAKAVQDGAAGEGGAAPSSGGTSNVAGSKNGGGSLNLGGDEPCDCGGAPLGGQGGAAAGDTGMLGGAAGADTSSAGAGGSGDVPGDMSLPAACPGVLGDYTLKVGTDGADHYLAADLNGKNLVFGLGGDDVFDFDYAGQDCLIGGPGDDVFTGSGEFASYFFGGPGADLFYLPNTYNYFIVEDMSADDTIGLVQTTFAFLAGTAGDTPDAQQLMALPGYAQGSASVPAGESGAIVYDPNDGSLWQDLDRGDKSTGAKQIGTIANFSTYTFDINDFVIE